MLTEEERIRAIVALQKTEGILHMVLNRAN